MLLKHKKFPKIKVNLPGGGGLVFDNFECNVLPETLSLVGFDFFNSLLSIGEYDIVGNKTLEEYFESAQADLAATFPQDEMEPIDVTGLDGPTGYNGSTGEGTVFEAPKEVKKDEHKLQSKKAAKAPKKKGK